MSRIDEDNLYKPMKVVARNAEDFSRLLKEIGPAMEGHFEKVARSVSLRIFRGVIQRTPVDTGLTRASWKISDANDGTTANPGDFPASNSRGSGRRSVPRRHSSDPKVTQTDMKKIKEASTIFIYNNFEHIRYLEAGSSDQAPMGIIALTLIGINNYLREALKK